MSDFGGTFDPLADSVGVAGPALDLRTILLGAGVPREDVDRAQHDGTLELLVFERMVSTTDRPQYSLDEVAALSGLSPDGIRAYWRALGFPDPRPDEKLFGDADLAMMSDVVWFISNGAIEPEIALQMARVIGSSLERVARAQVETIETRRAQRAAARRADPTAPVNPWDGDDEPSPAIDTREQLAIRRGTDLLPLMPKLMEFVWRRHVSDAARRRRLRAAAGEGANLCVGFADLVGFTAQTLQLAEEDLAEVITRFESIAYDMVSAHGGRVVKMIGDEVMFVADSARTGALIALALAEAYRSDPDLSDVRVGLASGPVLEREGDVYGPVVNLASRIVGVAYPGAVVVSEDVQRALVDDPGFVLRTIRQHYLKDIGRVHLWAMRRPGDDHDDPARRDPQRLARREFLLKRRADRAAAAHALPIDVEEEVAEILEDAGLLEGDDEHRLITGDEPTREFEAITDVVLDAEIDEELQVELLADIEATRRLNRLEREAQLKAQAADLEAEERIAAIEDDVRRKIESIEADARRRIEAALEDAERKAAEVNEEASRKVRKVADEAEKKAEEVEREARRVARRKTQRRRAEKTSKRPRPRPTRDR